MSVCTAACFFLLFYLYDLKWFTEKFNKDFWCCTCTLTCGSDKPGSETSYYLLTARRKHAQMDFSVFATPMNICFVVVVLHHHFKTNKVARGYWAGYWVAGTGWISMKTGHGDDVAMTTGRLSVQPGFGIFRHAAGSTQLVWGFNLLNGRKQAAASYGTMEWLGGDFSQASAKPQLQSAYMRNEAGGCDFIVFVFIYYFTFVTIQTQQWPSTETCERQTNR